MLFNYYFFQDTVNIHFYIAHHWFIFIHLLLLLYYYLLCNLEIPLIDLLFAVILLTVNKKVNLICVVLFNALDDNVQGS